ncbi:hypothetical protein OHA87_26025 [Streptomyces sp. NBC_00493]|uniref:hypothetical protein n=2 Tax=unclassified Streptomyces TaxID=2593676 RepID=UPI002E177AD5
MKRGLKLTAVATMVVVALTGFTTGRSHGHSKSRSSSSGGGCSSSSQSHDSTSSHVSKGGGSSYTRHTRHRSTTPSSSSTRNLQDATVKLLKCADAQQAYALVTVTNPNSARVRFDVHGAFLGTGGNTVADRHHEVEVASRGKATVQVPVGSKTLAADVDRCRIDPYARALG